MAVSDCQERGCRAGITESGTLSENGGVLMVKKRTLNVPIDQGN